MTLSVPTGGGGGRYREAGEVITRTPEAILTFQRGCTGDSKGGILSLFTSTGLGRQSEVMPWTSINRHKLHSGCFCLLVMGEEDNDRGLGGGRGRTHCLGLWPRELLVCGRVWLPGSQPVGPGFLFLTASPFTMQPEVGGVPAS